jgi:hypothetical protein
MGYGINNTRGEWFKQDKADVQLKDRNVLLGCTEPHLHTSFYKSRDVEYSREIALKR